MVDTAFITFGNLVGITAGSFSLTPGFVPSVAILQLPYRNNLAIPTGPNPLSLVFNNQTLTFPDCIADSASVSGSASGRLMVNLRILDRRWRWQYGEISGVRNLRLSDGSIASGTEMNARELANQLLTAIPEPNVGGGNLVPLNVFPEVSWISAVPAVELENLISPLGLTAVYQTNNQVRLVRVGQGAQLPNIAGRLVEDLNIDPPTLPRTIKVLAGPTVYSARLLLEAVGLDTDGTVKLVDELSYVPSGGWETESPSFFGNVLTQFGKVAHAKAKLSVWKWYRVSYLSQETAAQFGIFTDPGGGAAGDILRERLLPLSDSQASLQDVLGATFSAVDRLPAAVFGQYHPKGTKPDFNTEFGTPVNVAFDLDTERGIVKFNESVYFMDVNSGTRTFRFADLELQTSFGLRDSRDPWIWQRSFYLEPLPHPHASGVLTFPREDVRFTHLANYDSQGNLTNVLDNQALAAAELRSTAQSKAGELTSKQQSQRVFAGLINVSPDGAINQVTWNLGPSGFTTTVGRNVNVAMFRPKLAERKALEKLDAFTPQTRDAGTLPNAPEPK